MPEQGEFIQKYNIEKYAGALFASKNTPIRTLPAMLKDDCSKNIDKCNRTKKVIKTLKYYESLDIINNSKDIETFVRFCHEKGNQWLLDNYIHILNVHNNENDLNYIFDLLIQNGLPHCNIMKCTVSLRHYRNRHDDKYGMNTYDKEFLFYRNVMDQIHCFLYHLYDTALRVKKHQNKLEYEEDAKEQKSEDITQYIDQTFNSIYNTINKTKNKLMKKSGLGSNRFNISKFNVDVTKDTFMDGMMECITKDGKLSNMPIVLTIQKYLSNEEYESDAIQDDINEVNYKNSIIGVYSKTIYDTVKKYMYNHKLHQHTFNIGYRLYYWKYYKRKHTSIELQWHDNVNDHGGYNARQLFVPRKYNNMKHELLNNKIFTLNLSELQISMNKTYKYINTNYVKLITATPDYGDQLFKHDRNDNLHYGITAKTPISFNHLLSICLYCDWSELCTKFSATFRNKNSYESISMVIKNNSEFANWSRLLRETVELFGVSYSGQYNSEHKRDDDKIFNRLKGPFFCGMSFVMVIPQFNIRLCGPTSTSKQIEVATRFGGAKGIIIQLNNIDIVNLFSDNVSAFPCAWLSNYSGEDEYLFCGGMHRIKIDAITRIDTAQNFKQHFSVLFLFECMLNGMETKKKIKSCEYKCVDKLIRHKLKMNGFQNEFPKYINDTFEAFVNHKTHIVVSLPLINAKGDVNLGNLIVNLASTIKKENLYNLYSTYDVQMDKKWAFSDPKPRRVDLFKPILFDLFSNLNHITIYSTSIWGNEEYAMDLQYLATSIFKSTQNDIQIEIKAVERYDYEKWINKASTVSWISDIFQKSYSFKQTLEDKFCIEMKSGTNGIGRHEDCIVITRIKGKQYDDRLNMSFTNKNKLLKQTMTLSLQAPTDDESGTLHV
eukprot:479994_1